MKLKGRGILSLCLLIFGGVAIYDFVSSKKVLSDKMEDSRLMLLNFEQVEKVQIDRDQEHITILRSPEGWRLEQPLQELADGKAVDDFVRNIYPERILDVATEGPQVDWAQYGLSPAATTITLTDAHGEKNSFHISEKKNFESNIFARRNEENKVLILNPSWEARAQKTVSDFRDKRVLKSNIASVDEITLRNAQGSFTLHRVDGNWKVRGYNLELDQNKVREYLKTLADAKADQILDVKDLGSEQSRLFDLDVRMNDKKWSAQISQSSGTDKKIYALIGEPKTLLRLEPGTLDDFIKKELKSLEVTAAEHKKEESKGQTETSNKEEANP